MKIRLHQTFGAHAGRSRELDQDVITFGRLPSCDFAFDAHADLDASGSHAEIRREGATWVLRDVGSRNGTLVAGRPVQRHELTDGDEIEFGTGGPRVRVELVASAPARPMGTMAATPILGAAPAPSPPASAGAAPFAPTATPTPEPKKYGQATLDAAVEAAAAKARAEALGGGHAPKGTALLPQSQLPQPGGPPAYLAPTAVPPAPIAVSGAVAPSAAAPGAAASPASTSTMWLIGSIVALFVFLVLCLLSCVLLGYLYQYG